jgi:predicted nuclease with TOPRIM domain
MDLNFFVSTLLSGGLLAAIGAIIVNRRQARKIDVESDDIVAKRPAEIDSVIVTGAEKTVLIMERANDTLVGQLARQKTEADERAANLSAQNGALRARVDQLEAENAELHEENRRLRAYGERMTALLETYRQRLDTAEQALVVAREEYAVLEAEVASFRERP